MKAGNKADSLKANNCRVFEYAPLGSDFIYKKTKDISKLIGLGLSVNNLKNRYGATKRCLIER